MLEKLPEVIGHALHNQRAGLDNIVFNRIDLRAGMASIEVSSLAFKDHMPIPSQYTADGIGISPPIQWKNIPNNIASLVMIVEDADSPTPHPLVHAIAVDLMPQDGSIQEGALVDQDIASVKLGRNSFLQTGWLPPDPPPGHGVHRYAFQIFALKAIANFSETPGREEVFEAVEAYAVASGCLIGTYERHDASIKLGDAEDVLNVGVSDVKPV
jgi:Raf kinase inhibitor-like YbhB/YbcL family protein